MKNKKKKTWKLGGIIFCIVVFVFSCMTPMNVQCEQGKKAKTQTEEETIENAILKLENADSMHSSVSMEMEVEVFQLNLETEASVDMVSFRSPYKIKSESSLDMGLLGEKEWTVYAAKENGAYQIYEKAGRKWSVQEAQAKELLKYDGRNLLKIFLSQIEGVQEEGEERLEDDVAVKYSGAIPSDGLKKILLDAGSIELADNLFQNSLLKPFGTLLEQKEKVASMIETSNDLKVILWIDKSSGYPIQCKMDLSEMIGATYKELLEGISSEKAKKLAEKVEIQKAEIIIECDDFNRAENFKLPTE